MTLRTRITLVAIAVTLLVAISLIVTGQVSQLDVLFFSLAPIFSRF